MEQTIERALPNNVEAERSVLGAMLLESEALDSMLEQLFPEDFYQSAHADIFAAMRSIRFPHFLLGRRCGIITPII